MNRVGVVVHPTRSVRGALETLHSWTATRSLEVLQVQAGDRQPQVAPSGEVNACDLIVAIGGDGTVLTALHAAAETRTPVIGVACGTLGALSTVSPAELRGELERFAAGGWFPRHLPALSVETSEGHAAYAINDLVLVRRGATQLVVEVSVDEDLYARLAGDGIVVATALGSSAYSMAAGGSLLVAGSKAFVCTPLAMHGGCAPPLVVTDDRQVMLAVDGGTGGFELQVDGHRVDSTATRFAVSTKANYAALVGTGHPDTGLPNLRRRGLITDSPRVLARQRWAAHGNVETPPGR